MGSVPTCDWTAEACSPGCRALLSPVESHSSAQVDRLMDLIVNSLYSNRCAFRCCVPSCIPGGRAHQHGASPPHAAPAAVARPALLVGWVNEPAAAALR